MSVSTIPMPSMPRETMDEKDVSLEDHIRDYLQTKDFAAAEYFYGDFDDHPALGKAIRAAINETTGTYRSFEDGIRQHWSPTRKEELAFARFLTEYEAMFWTARRDVLQDHADTVATDSVEEFLANLDRHIRREILARIEAELPVLDESETA